MADANSPLWLPVKPSLRDFGPALMKGVAGDAEKAGKVSGKKFGLALAGAAATVAGMAAAGTALYNVGKTFNDMTNTIRVGTGATGKDLDGLVQVAKNVGTKVPADFDKISSTVADVNTRMGLSGDVLDTVASQYLEAGRILGEDVDIMKTGAAFNAFAIEGEDVSGALDHLFRVSQATGIGMNELAGTVQNAAPAAKALGFSFEETAGMVGTLDKAGLNSSKMMAGLSRGLVELSKDGEKPADAFKRVVGEMQGFVEKGDEAGAMDIASKIFGTRNASQFLDAVKTGNLELDSLADVAGMTEDTILGAGKETMTFSEHWQTFKNKILVALAPVAEKVFGLMGDLMEKVSDVLSEHILPAFEGFIGWLEKSYKWVVPLVGTIGGLALAFAGVSKAIAIVTSVTQTWNTISTVAKKVQESLNKTVAANKLMLIVTAIAAVVAALVWFFTKTELGREIWQKFTDFFQQKVMPAFKAVGDFFVTLWNDHLKPVFQAIGDFFAAVWTDVLKPAIDAVVLGFQAFALGIAGFWNDTLKPVFKAIGDFFKNMWDTVLKVAFDSVKNGFDLLVNGVKAYWDLVLKPTFKAIGDFFKWVWDYVLSPAFKNVRAGFETMQKGIKSLWDNFLKPTFKAIGDFFKSVWENVLSPAFTSVKTGFDTMRKGIASIWTDFLKPVFKAVGDFFRSVWNDVLAPAFTSVKTGFDNLRKGIGSIWTDKLKPIFDAVGKFVKETVVQKVKDGVKAIQAAWKKVANFFREPINWVIRTVFNNGIVKGFNWVTDKLGMADKKIPALSQIPAFAKGGKYRGGLALVGEEGPELINFNQGGWVSTAKQTEQIARGLQRDLTPEETRVTDGRRERDALLPAGGNWITDLGAKAVEFGKGAVDWVKDGLAKAVDHLFLKPLKTVVSNSIPAGNWLGSMARTMSTNLIDGLRDWVAGKDAESGFGSDGGPIFRGTHLGRFARPASGPVTSHFGRRWGGVHSGIDLAVPIGSAIRAAWDGIVQKASWNALVGRTGMGMVLSHAKGIQTYYGHLSGWVKKVGDKVKAGDVIARSGNTGRSTGPHLHFETIHGGQPRNPAYLFRDRGGNLPPGLSMVLNRTGRDETILPVTPAEAEAAFLAGRGGPSVHIENAYAMSTDDLARDIAARQRRAARLRPAMA